MSLFSLREAAAELGVDYETARAWVHSGALKAVRLAGRRTIQVRREDIDAFIADSEIVPNTVPMAQVKRQEMSRKRRGQQKANVLEMPWYAKHAR